MRPCPRCTYPLSAYEHLGIEVDLCRRCGGMFLDPGDATRTLGPEAEPETWLKSDQARRLGPSALPCPKDQEELHAFRVAWGGRGVTVDLCPRCRGLWLDKDEGVELRRLVAAGRRAQAQVHDPLRDAEHQVKVQDANLEQINDSAPPPGVASYLFQLFTGLPIEVHNPVRTTPVMVMLTVGVLFLCFFAQLGAPEITEAWSLVPAQLGSTRGLVTLFTNTLLHGGWAHILGNVYFLWVFGDNVEDRLGHLRFVLLYVLAALGASALHALTHLGDATPCLGASGAVAGLMGAYFVLFPRVKLWLVMLFVRFKLSALWYLGLWAAYQFLMGLSNMPRIAWYAHFGGFVVGMAMAWRLRPTARERAERHAAG